jgi:hypothetical protein
MSKNAGDFGRLWSGGGDKQNTSIPEPGRISGPPATRTSRAYVAFETREHAQRLHIRCAAQPSRYPAYSCLLDIIYDHDFGKTFTLVYSFMMVEVTGHHLGAIVQAIAEGNCERIREFHHKLYDAPEPGAPVIETVAITVAYGN